MRRKNRLRRFTGKLARFARRRKGKLTLKNHVHALKPMRGLTSIPLRFRGRRVS